ncbi:MAG: hypothetical protein JWO86_3771 [Myxococcaceae bacterium]|nr:hypothetical protein [Myxococcaceae bacterium]
MMPSSAASLSENGERDHHEHATDDLVHSRHVDILSVELDPTRVGGLTPVSSFRHGACKARPAFGRERNEIEMAMDNMGLVRRFVDEVWNKGNLGAIDELVSDKYVAVEPIIGEVRGLDALRTQVQTFRSGFPDLRLTIEDIGTSGDRVFMRWTARGTHRGIFMGIPPTNNRGEIRGITIDRIGGGKLVEHHGSYDSLLLLQITGAVPPIDRIMTGQGAGQPVARPQA